MWRSKFSQAIFAVLLLTIVVSLMAFIQQGFTIQIVNTKQVNGQHSLRQDGTRVNMHIVTGSLKSRISTTREPPSIPPPTTARPTTKKPVEKNPVPDKQKLNEMSDRDIANFYHSYVMSPQSTCLNVRRMGLVKDGGWEMCDDVRFKPNPKKCLVYSFGINFDFSYDDDMAEYGCEIHAFDPSMRNTKDHLRGRRVHFHATGISGHDGTMNGNHMQKWKVYTLRTHRKMLNHSIGQRRIDIVKMDIEGSEVATLGTALREGSLKDVRQLSWETHLSLNGQPGRGRYIEYLDIMRSLHDAGFRIYLTSRNHVWSSFMSRLVQKQRVTCHEINMVNINLINDNNNVDVNSNNNNNNKRDIGSIHGNSNKENYIKPNIVNNKNINKNAIINKRNNRAIGKQPKDGSIRIVNTKASLIDDNIVNHVEEIPPIPSR